MLSTPDHTPMPHIQAFAPPPLPQGASSLHYQLYMGHVFHGRQIPPALTRLLTTYVVTSDKAARAYEAGCQRIDDHMHRRGNTIEAYIEGLGHFETCINSVKRALRVFELLVRHRAGIPVDRVIRRRVERYGESVTALRNAIEHIEQMLDGLHEGDAHLLAFSPDGTAFEIGAHTFAVSDLGTAVGVLYKAGVSIIHALPSPSENTELNPRPQIETPP